MSAGLSESWSIRCVWISLLGIFVTRMVGCLRVCRWIIHEDTSLFDICLFYSWSSQSMPYLVVSHRLPARSVYWGRRVTFVFILTCAIFELSFAFFSTESSFIPLRISLTLDCTSTDILRRPFMQATADSRNELGSCVFDSLNRTIASRQGAYKLV